MPSWLDVPAAVCGWWILVGVPISIVAISMLLRDSSVRERRTGRVVLGGAAMLFCCWMAAMVFVFTATSR